MPGFADGLYMLSKKVRKINLLFDIINKDKKYYE